MIKTITVKATTPDGKEQGPTSAIIEVDRGAGYLRLDGRDIVTNSSEEQVFELEPGQRLVIEAWPPQEAVMDHDQSAAVLKSNQGKPRVADSAAAGKSASDLRKQADEMDRREQESIAKAKSATAEADATHKKTLSEINEAAKSATPAATSQNQASSQAGKASAANPMKSSKDMK